MVDWGHSRVKPTVDQPALPSRRTTMAKDSFFKRLACHFKPTHNEPQQDEPQGDNQPSPNIVVEIPESTRTAIEKLQNVPLAIEDLREAISRQTSACEKLRSLNEPDARVSELLDRKSVV